MQFMTNGNGFGGINHVNGGPSVDPLTTMRSRYAAILNNRLARNITFFSLAAWVPTMTPSVSDRNITVDFNQFCSKSGLNGQGNDKAGTIAASVYAYVGIQMPTAVIARELAAYGLSYDTLISVRQMILEVMRLPFIKNTIKTTQVETVVARNDGQKNKGKSHTHSRRGKRRSDRYVNYTIDLGSLKTQLISWAYGLGKRPYAQANTLALHVLFVPPAVRTSTEAQKAPATDIVAIIVGDNLVVVDCTENTSLQEIQTVLEGMVSDEAFHDIDSSEHQVPFSRGLNMLVQQGWAPIASFGIKDVKKFKVEAARNGLNKAYSIWLDEVASKNEVNPKIQTNAQAIRQIVKRDALTPEAVSALREKATTVCDDVTTSPSTFDSGVLVGVGAQNAGFANSLGIPSSFPLPGASYGPSSPFGTTNPFLNG